MGWRRCHRRKSTTLSMPPARKLFGKALRGSLMKSNTPSLSEQLAKIEEEGYAEDAALWGPQAGRPGPNDLANSPKFQELVRTLHEHPILVEPALNWLREKQAQLARAQLEVLYSPEQLAEMYEQVKVDEK